MIIHSERVFVKREGVPGKGPVVYWMSRDQRVKDNRALLFAIEHSVSLHQPLIVLFNLVPSYLNAQPRHYSFMLGGLKNVKKDLEKLSIPIILIRGEPASSVTAFLNKIKAGSLVTDFNPLKVNKMWVNSVISGTNIPVYEIDAHNIVPCRVASGKQEYSARTLRPKIYKLLPEFLTEFPVINGFTEKFEIESEYRIEEEISDIPDFPGIKPGEEAAHQKLEIFIQSGLDSYHERRNHPETDGLSGLSPYLHFGQISAQRVALEVVKLPGLVRGRAAFLEELIIRRELADNFCFYNNDYDSFKGFPNWSKKSLDAHRLDEREFLYSREEFENAATHDDLWNAAQMEMVNEGKMHGYLRMYWAKKILEWTHSPEEAMEIAIYLNDKYSLDGRDPNGYTGIAWSIGGVHDRPWFNRHVFGSVRYMSLNGMKSKFNTESYILQHRY